MTGLDIILIIGIIFLGAVLLVQFIRKNPDAENENGEESEEAAESEPEVSAAVVPEDETLYFEDLPDNLELNLDADPDFEAAESKPEQEEELVIPEVQVRVETPKLNGVLSLADTPDIKLKSGDEVTFYGNYHDQATTILVETNDGLISKVSLEDIISAKGSSSYIQQKSGDFIKFVDGKNQRYERYGLDADIVAVAAAVSTEDVISFEVGADVSTGGKSVGKFFAFDEAKIIAKDGKKYLPYEIVENEPVTVGDVVVKALVNGDTTVYCAIGEKTIEVFDANGKIIAK